MRNVNLLYIFFFLPSFIAYFAYSHCRACFSNCFHIPRVLCFTNSTAGRRSAGAEKGSV